MQPIVESLAVWALPAIAAVLLHDAVQRMAASWLPAEPDAPDPSPNRLPRILRAIDPVGTVIVPIALALTGAPVFGWPRYRPFALGEDALARWRRLVSALAGPVASFAAALIGAMALGALVAAAGGVMPDHGVAWLVTANLFNFILANACMTSFHLLPVPPFDMGRGLSALLPLPLRQRLRKAGRLVVLAVIATVVAIPLLDPHARIGEWIAAPMINAITRFVLGLVNLTV
jgi:Zn-dependent protease